jgi:hypothetical protein
MQQKIQVCYLDTTYLNPRYSFPPQEDVIRSCAELCVSLRNALEAENEDEFDALLRRREGAGAGIGSVSKYFTPSKSTGGNSPSRDEDTSSSVGPSAAPNAFAALKRRNRNRLLVVCGTYSIGKERICKAIAQVLRTKIFASPGKRRMCAQLGDPELTALLTDDPAEGQVHMQMLMEIRAETLAEYLESYRAHFGRIVGFLPTGWNYRPATGSGGAGMGSGAAAAGSGSVGIGRNVGANLPPSSVPTTQLLHGGGWRTRFTVRDLVPQRGSTREAMCFGVPYSEHSSFRELALFLMALRIEKVVPTVNVGSEPSRRRMKGWIDRWMAERRRGGLVRVLEKNDEERDTTEQGAKTESKKDLALWDGKDGRGGGVYW